MRVLHHMNRHNCLSTNSSTYHPLWVSFKCCAALILLSSFSSRVRLVSSEYLTTSGRENPLSSCPMNPEISGNRISVPMDWADRVALTDNSNSVYRKRFTWLFHDFGFWMEWVGRELPRRRLWHRSSKQLSWESGHVKGIWPLAQRSRYRHHFNRVFVSMFDNFILKVDTVVLAGSLDNYLTMNLRDYYSSRLLGRKPRKKLSWYLV